MLQRAQSLANDTDLDADPNLVSTPLHNTAQGIAQRLQAASGLEQEQGYIETQIALHENTLAMLDHTLIPNANDANLRQMLQEARQDVASHLQQARQIHATMMAHHGIMHGQHGMMECGQNMEDCHHDMMNGQDQTGQTNQSGQDDQ